ncbi:MAG: hypothetical protein AB4372_07295 [Xenococcus sp. (in: cyanobacteria)]
MNYYFSLVLALGITTFNLPQGNLSLDSRNQLTQNKSYLVRQVTVKNVEFTVAQQLKSNDSESSVESKPNNFNQNLLLAAIAGTSIFTAILLLLLFKKVEINLEEENIAEEQSDSQAEKVLDDTVIVEKPQSLANESVENNAQSSQQEQLQDTVLMSSHTSTTQEQETLQDTKIMGSQTNTAQDQKPLDDTVIVPPHVVSPPLDVVPKLIQELQKGDREITSQTIKKLSQSGDSRAMIPLVEFLIEADTQQRSLILEAMSKISIGLLKPMNQALILSLGDEDSVVKQNAIRDLTRMYEITSQVTEKLSQTINNSEEKLPETTQWALQQLKQMPETPTWQLTKLINNGKMITDT